MQHLIIPSVALFMAVSALAVTSVGKKPHRSISQHVAESRSLRILFGVVASAASLLAALAVFGWMLPHYQAGIFSYIVFGLLLLGFFVAAVLPHIEDTWRGTVHNIAAWGIVYIVPLAMALALLWPLSTVAWGIGAFLLVINCVLLFLALYKREKYRKNFLYFQAAYVGIMYLLLVVVTYI